MTKRKKRTRKPYVDSTPGIVKTFNKFDKFMVRKFPWIKEFQKLAADTGNFGNQRYTKSPPKTAPPSKEIKTLSKAVLGLSKVISSIAKDVRSNLAISKEIQAQLGSLKAADSVSASDLKPETITHEGKEYLHYPGAPENRKFYEKSQKGTAGKIVKKSVQEKLKPLVKNNKTAEKMPSTPSVDEITNSIISMVQTEQIKTVEKILAEKAPEREKQVSDILYKMAKKQASNEVDNNEEKDMLRDALYEALSKIIKDHPDLLKCSGGGGSSTLGDLADLASRRGLGRLGRIGRAVGGRIGRIGRGIANSRLGQGIGRMFRRIPRILPGTGGIVPSSPSAPSVTPEPMGPPKPSSASPSVTPEPTATPKPTTAPSVTPASEASTASKAVSAAEKAAPTAIKKPGVGSRLLGALGKAKGAVGRTFAKVAGKAAVKSIIKKIPVIGAIAGLGFAGYRMMQGDYSGAALEAASGIAGTVPGVGTAASVGLDAALAAKDAGVFDSKAPETPNVTPSQMSPTAVLSEQQKAAPDSGAALMELNRTVSQVQVPKVSIPAPQINNITTNKVMSNSTSDRISIYNRENTFNRLQMQDMDHPSSYSNFNMG